MDEILETLKTDTSITTFTIKSEYLNEDNLETLIYVLNTNTTLTTLQINETIGSNEAIPILKALINNTSLEVLDLSNNYIEDDVSTVLQELLLTNTALKVLNLSGNDLMDETAVVIAEALKSNQTLIELVLSDNNFQRAGKAILYSLSSNTTLEVLKLSHCSIQVLDATILEEMLKNNTSIYYLDLSENMLEIDGFVAVFNAFKGSSTIDTLKLNHVVSQFQGLERTRLLGEAVADFLGENQTLQHLEIAANSIGREGADKIYVALKHNTLLLSLNISNNEIDGVSPALVEMIVSNKHLESLNASKNRFGHDVNPSTLSEAIYANRTLIELNIVASSERRIHKEEFKEIDKHIRVNRNNKRAKTITLFELLLSSI